jgi:hypothetical protein
MPMTKQTRAKQERVVEGVRRGLDGDGAVEFIRQSGFAMSSAGIARHLRQMGGRGRIEELIEQGKSNAEILVLCFPGENQEGLPDAPPSQTELFSRDTIVPIPHVDIASMSMFETRKLAIKVPTELYEAIRLAAKGEKKSQNQLIVDILRSALARMPGHIQQELEELEETEE